MRTKSLRGVQQGAIVVAALALSACGGGSTQHRTTSSTPRASAQPVSYAGPTLQHPAPAPPLVLRNYLGQRVDLQSYRGHAVLLTFVYTHCPDVCPLIISNLHNALAQLGPEASKVRIVAVTTDPKGDTRSAVADFLARRGMTGRMEYLVGTRGELVPVWRSWGISVANPTAQDEVNHSALVYGISASGKVTTVYPSNFTPKDIAHDVPLLNAT
jgi:protein SCO1